MKTFNSYSYSILKPKIYLESSDRALSDAVIFKQNNQIKETAFDTA